MHEGSSTEEVQAKGRERVYLRADDGCAHMCHEYDNQCLEEIMAYIVEILKRSNDPRRPPGRDKMFRLFNPKKSNFPVYLHASHARHIMKIVNNKLLELGRI
ncbi:hypothetical protein DBV05_g9311 [Lasiodiplodia theobromae]|uniref:Uncharacterized protein n=1 Tax=Lasiodiplodia theobromae TaxID=45133 RepID=A0A5N5D2W3_9PEZI|nr:hypothetical protein DBV05_g9311 [Lasiodiplodia theobromae]